MPGRELRVRPRDRERGQRRPDAVPQREPRPCRAQAARAETQGLGQSGWLQPGPRWTDIRWCSGHRSHSDKDTGV